MQIYTCKKVVLFIKQFVYNYSRFDIKDYNANPLFVINNDSPGPGNNINIVLQQHMKDKNQKLRAKVNIKEL